MSNPAPTLNQINAFNATQGTTIDFNIIGGTEVIRSNKIYIYDLSDNSLICTHLYVSTESIHELPPNTSSSIVYASGKSSADFTNNTQYYAQIQTFTDVGGTQGGSGLSIAKLFWCLPTPTLTLSTIPTTISTTSYNVSATYTPNTSGGVTNEVQEFQFNLYSAIGALLQTSGVVLYGESVDLSYNFSGLEVDSTYYVTLDVTTTQGMNVSAQSNTFTVSIDTPTMGSASVVNNGCDGYISVTSNLSSEYEHEESTEVGEIMSFTTDSVNDITELDVDFSPVQDGTPWMSAQNTEPYTFRAVPTQTEDFGHESDTIVGGTVAWNQLVQNGNFENTNGWSSYKNTLVASGNIATATIANEEPLTSANINRSFAVQSGHKYMLVFSINSSTSGNAGYYVNDGGIKVLKPISAGAWTQISAIRSATSNSSTLYLYLPEVANAVVQIKNVMAFDLTQMFGSTIADYIYSLEQATEGAGVAWFKKLFPKPYYAYNAGELMSVNTSAHNTVGFNAWDEEWEQGGINQTTGANTSNSNAIRSKNYIRVVPNATYYVKAPIAVRGYWYDADKNYINTESLGVNTTFTVPSGACYLRFIVGNSTTPITTYGNNICINLSWDGERDGEYEEYVKHSYPLDSSLTLRGIPKLDASNNLYYDGDTYEADGTVTRKYGIVDLGTLDWVYNSTTLLFRTGLTDGIKVENAEIHCVCQKYRAVVGYNPTGGINDTTQDKVISVGSSYESTNNNLLIRDDSYTDATTFKTAMSGVYLVYELATPTTETADPYTNPQIVDPSGTEQYVGSPIPVGHETTYQRICPISGWDSVEVDVSGVNLNPYSGVNYIVDNTRERFFLKAGTYTFSTDTGNQLQSGANYYIRLYDAETGENVITDGNITSDRLSLNGDHTMYYGGSGYVTVTFTLAIDAWICFGFNNITPTTCNAIQLEVGSNHTSYTPYQGTTYTSTFPKYKQQVSQDKTPYITKNIGDTYADTLTENLVGGTIAWNQSVPDTTTTHTISGSIASMDDAVAGNFESVVCDIEPRQDLHGYDKPWVGGAGKNFLKPSQRTVTSNGVTYSVDANGTITLTGTATADERFTIYVVSAGTVPETGYYTVSLHGAINAKLNNGTAAYTLKIAADTAPSAFYIGVTSGTTYNESFNVQIEKGSTATAYAPYENICPITGWTGCEVDVAGVNLCYKVLPNPLSLVNANYAKVITGAGTTAIFKAVKGQTYRVSGATGRSRSLIAYFDSDPVIDSVSNSAYQSSTQDYSDGYVFTAQQTAYCACYLANSVLADVNIQIERGTTASNYHAYNGTTYPVSWQTEAGTVYGGTVDLVTGVLTVTMVSVDLGTLTYTYDTSLPYPFMRSGGIKNYVKKPSVASELANIMCSALEPQTSYSIGSLNAKGIGIHIVGEVRIAFDGMSTDTTAFKASMDGVYLVYELATPTTYQLDPVQVACLLGHNNVWNNIANTTVTYPTNHSYQSLSTTHKYYKRINGVESISVGSDVVADVGTDNIIDLTQMFGTTIADYIYNREQSSSSGMGVKFFKSLFPNDDYDYNSGTLISVNASAHVIKDANGNVLHTYPLDSDLVLRGIPKLDANNKLYYDGDVYEPDGSVTRKYGIVDLGTLNWAYYSDYQMFYAAISGKKAGTGNLLCSKYRTTDLIFTVSNDKSVGGNGSNGTTYIRDTSYNTDAAAFKTAMSGVYLVYELATPTTEQADPFEENQSIVSNGIEEYTVTEQGDVEMPVGHDSTYYATGVYGGTIDMAKGVLTVDRVETTYDGSNDEAWFAGGNGRVYIQLNAMERMTDYIGSIYCDKLPTIKDHNVLSSQKGISGYALDSSYPNQNWVYVAIDEVTTVADLRTWLNANPIQVVYPLATPIEISLTPQQMQTLSGQNNVWSNTNGGMFLVYQLPITALLVKRRDVADVSGKWLTLYSTPITQASDMDFTFIDFLNQYGKKYQYALVPVLAQNQSGVVVQIEGGYTVSDNVDSIFDGVYIADQTNVERVKAGVGYGNIDMNQGVGSITPIGSKYPIVITNSQNQYHNGSIRGTIVPNDFYSNGNLSRIDMVNKRDELEQFLTNKRAKIIKDWNGKMWLVMIMSNVNCSFDDNYGMGMVSFSADWLEVGDPTNQQDLYNAGLINVGGV